MSEYITIETEIAENADDLLILTNQQLSLESEPEVYPDAASGQEGSPLAQTLFNIEGIIGLTLDGQQMTIRRDPGVEWFILIDEVRDALKDFFL